MEEIKKENRNKKIEKILWLDLEMTGLDIEKDKEIADYFQIKVIPGLLVIRERAGIFAHDDGEVSAKAFDEIITWAREYDMSTVKDYYKREGSGQIN